MATTAAVIDVGGGASTLAVELVHRGFGDVTVLDVSARAVDAARSQLGAEADRVDVVVADVLSWKPERRFDVWHDRAVFHFLVDAEDRARYLATLEATLSPGGRVIVATFALDGPEQCSGLPTAHYDESSLVAMFGAGYQLVESRREEHRTPAGGVQPFTWVALRRAVT